MLDTFNAGGINHGRCSRHDSSGTIRVAGTTVEIEADVARRRVASFFHSHPVGGLMVSALRALRRSNVLTARCNRRCRELQRQQCEHEDDEERAH